MNNLDLFFRYLKGRYVIGINRTNAKSAETPCCHGNRLIYRLKFYPAQNRSRNVTEALKYASNKNI